MIPLHLTGTGGGLGPVVLIALGVTVLGCWYAAGLWEVMDHPQGRRQQRWRAPAVLTGVVVLLAVTVPPLGDVLEERLSTHMAQHLVILTVVAPLLAVGAPGQVLLAALSPTVRRPLVALAHHLPGRALATPLAWLVSVAGLWLWHLPAAYDAAVRSTGVHLLEHATFLLTAWLFWARLVRLARTPGRGIAAAAYVAAAVPPGAALGAVLTFADRPLYPLQAAHARAVGIDPLLDQRIAGIVMWVPLDLVYLAVAIWLFARWLRGLQESAPDAAGTSTLPADVRPAQAEVTSK
ncbi:cytochrome c oxidase assembly protein [Nocardioides sp. KR10-350]|uniref:cytochrome c oxidase assembly protein n=1 Tax=Nocardioides cheoyonin TaxID=3156615 RepID=UPI0032B39E3B